MTHLEESCVGRFIALNAGKELCWDLSGCESSSHEIGILKLGESLSIELCLELLENMSKFCKRRDRTMRLQQKRYNLDEN